MFVVKLHKALITLFKSRPASQLWLLSAAALHFPMVSVFSFGPPILPKALDLVGRAVCGRGYACMFVKTMF